MVASRMQERLPPSSSSHETLCLGTHTVAPIWASAPVKG